MLSMNSHVLNLFELFSGIEQDFRFQTEPVSGKVLADQLRLDHPMLTMVMRRGGEVPEVVYPFSDPSSRYELGDPVPWALAIAIPRISDEPDRLFDELLDWVEARTVAPLSVHYRAIFDWLTERGGKDCWLERSGNSIDYLGELREFFPDARFVHIHRDGREAALSMREYATLRVAVAVMNGLAGEIEYTHEGLTALERDKPERIDELLATRSPIELYGNYWSDQIRSGYAARAKLDPRVVLDVRFEDLVTRPREVLEEISDFLTLPADPGWIESATKLSRGLPALRFTDLGSAERDRLDSACREAMALVGR
jgi:putative sulfotransferase